MYEWLDESTRQLLFNQEDYNALSEELIDIQYEAQRLNRQYERDLANSTLETVESITSQYQMQYETLMKSYEIAKADLDIAKKKQKLNNVLNERNVRMFINGQWQWVANTEDVANAKAELADAEYAKRVAESGLVQQQSINNLTMQQNALAVTIKKFESGIIDLGEAVNLAKNAIGSLPYALSSMYTNVTSVPISNTTSSSGSSARSSSSSGYMKNVDYKALIQQSTSVSEALRYNKQRNEKIAGEGINESTLSTDEVIAIVKENKAKNQHADGTRYTPGGLTLMGEVEPEIFIDNDGHLIPINQPTLANIGAGGAVFNQEQLSNVRGLWDLSNIGKFNHSSIVEHNMPNQNIDNSNCNNIIINGMTVDSGSADGQNLMNALRRYIGNH